MSRTPRIAVLTALALLVIAAGSVLATRAPSAADEPDLLAASQAAEREPDELEASEEDPTGAEHARERLADAGLAVDPGTFDTLAAEFGLGGAVRLVAWADATGLTVDELAAMRRDDGTGQPAGWGVLANELGVHPGIGSIMGRGNGSPPEVPPGQEKQQDD